MKITKNLLQVGLLGLSLLASSVMAAVSADEAAKLGTTLTPMGAEKAGNAAGTIPAWTPMPKNAGTWTARASCPTRMPARNRCSPSPRRTSSNTRTSWRPASTR